MKDILSFCPELTGLIGSGEANGESSTTQNVFGLSTVNNLVILRNLFIAITPKRTLEVGLGFGGSAMLFTASHRQAGHPPMAQHTAIDPFQTDWNDMALVALDSAGLRGYLDFRPEFSSIALPTLVREGARFELIFIDGSHFFDDVFVDFYFTTQLLADGGVVVFDDSTNPHVRKVLRFIGSNCGCLRAVDLRRYRADRRKSLRYRAAKALGRIQLTAFRKIGPWMRPWDVPLKNF
jgi:cephalosporin hydroxylase